MRRIEYKQYPFASQVLAVAVLNFELDENREEYLFDWAAYIDAVPGLNHELEYMNVAQRGTKLNWKVAKVLFPNIDPVKWRY